MNESLGIASLELAKKLKNGEKIIIRNIFSKTTLFL